MKAVFVFEMPDDCPVCPMAHWNKIDEFTGCDAVSGKKYAINDKEYAESSCRPSWCPLKPMPQKTYAESPDSYKYGFADGWNRCLEEIHK